MRIILACLLLLFFVSINESVPKKNLTCLTGHKLLTRTKYPTIQNQPKNKLQYRCLCPNNYFGQECETHLGMDCYLTPVNSLNEINSSNISDEMGFNVEFTADCYVVDKKDLKLGKIQLRQFLNLYNQHNHYGVKEQFGINTEIVWANDTELFDLEGELISQQKSPNLTKQLKTKILIGQNQGLQQTPFAYEQTFLNYGLINGNVTFLVDILNPQAGSFRIANFSQNQVQISGFDEYVESYVDFSQIQEKRQIFIKNFTEVLKNGTLNETIQKYINGSQRAQDFNFSNGPKINPQQRPLPKISIPIKITPRNQTFYETIRIQVSIIQNYQEIITHETSLNSVQWAIPVKVQGLGLPQPISKHLIVTDANNKSYYRILIVVGIVGLIYLGLTFGYKRYKKWKNQQYTQFEDEEIGGKRNGVEARRDSDSKMFKEESIRSQRSQNTESYHKSDETNINH